MTDQNLSEYSEKTQAALRAVRESGQEPAANDNQETEAERIAAALIPDTDDELDRYHTATARETLAQLIEHQGEDQ